MLYKEADIEPLPFIQQLMPIGNKKICGCMRGARISALFKNIHTRKLKFMKPLDINI